MPKIGLFLSGLFCLLMITSCKEPDITPENNEATPIEIQVKSIDNGVEISWPEANLRNFKDYTLIRTTFKEGFFGNQVGDTVWMIDDYKQTKIQDRNLPTASPIYYQLFVNSTTRTFNSQRFEHKRTDLFVFDDLNWNSISANSVKNLFYLFFFNGSSSDVSLVNYENGQVIKGDFKTDVTKFGLLNSDEFYQIGNLNTEIFNAETMKQKLVLEQDPNSFERFTSVAAAKGRYYAYTENSNIQIYDNQGKLIKSYKTKYVSSDMVLHWLPGTNKLIALATNGSLSALIINLNDNGDIISNTAVSSNGSYYYYGINMLVSPDGKNIFSSQTIFNNKLERIKTLNDASGSSGLQNYSFSPDGKFFAYRSNNQNIFKILETENFSLIKSVPINVKSSFNAFMSLSNTHLIIGEQQFNSFGKNRLVLSKTKFQ